MSCRYLYLLWYLHLLGVLLSTPFSGVLQINPTSVSMTSPINGYVGYNSPNLVVYITIGQLVLVIPFRTLGMVGLPGEKFERFSILQILCRPRRSIGVHPYCPYRAIPADSLGSELTKASPVHSCYALRRRTQCIILLKDTLRWRSYTQVQLQQCYPGTASLSTPHSLGERCWAAGTQYWLAFSSPPETPC